MYKYIYVYSFLKFENKQKNTDNAQKIAKIKPLTMIHAVQKNVKRKWIQTRPEFFYCWRKLKKYLPKASIFSSVPLNKCNGVEEFPPAEC